ncbi:hypothetical protein FRC0337_00233 [Corynebacterium diphtheriae]|nr:hypothetical protein FRC0337_00233 [Corynebacterium diphtheriae]
MGFRSLELEEVTEEVPNARAATAEEAAQAGDIVVVTIPLNSLHEIPIEQLDSREITTSPILQDRVPEAKVVKAFSNINFSHLGELARPEHADARTSLVIAGDDDSAIHSPGCKAHLYL